MNSSNEEMTELSDKEKLVERSGVLLEDFGLSPMAGRVVGYLMISDVPIQSLTDIAENLKSSKSAISSATKLLTQLGFVKKRGRPGDRQDYYEINPSLFETALSFKTEAIEKFQVLIRDALNFNKSSPRKDILSEMYHMYEFFKGEYRQIFKRWEEHKLKLIAEGKLPMEEPSASVYLNKVS